MLKNRAFGATLSQALSQRPKNKAITTTISSSIHRKHSKTTRLRQNQRANSSQVLENTLFTIEIKRLTYRNHPRKHTLRQRPPFSANRSTKRPPIHLNSSPPHSHNKPRSSTPGSVLRGVLIWLLWEIALIVLLLCFFRPALNRITPYPVC